ncbi:predicted protein [Arabidopsis lyrata subsp. lyrata]|uniref:Predicted protein n=1 Tax=Arabidopsis lyrata subsp. lyrata TaxID=81972 RepID=D7KY86_ARALL|nr:predicted protein [Arabidopsis lyrata subsp. lyrata]
MVASLFIADLKSPRTNNDRSTPHKASTTITQQRLKLFPHNDSGCSTLSLNHGSGGCLMTLVLR